MEISPKYLPSALLIASALLTGGCQTPAPSPSQPDAEIAASDSASLLSAAQQAVRKGNLKKANALYRQVGSDSASPQDAAAALMGRFMLRIDPNGSLRDTKKARAIARELSAFASKSKNPIAEEFARAAAMAVERQNAINTLAAEAEELKETKALLAEKDQELQKKEAAINRLKKVLISN